MELRILGAEPGQDKWHCRLLSLQDTTDSGIQNDRRKSVGATISDLLSCTGHIDFYTQLSIWLRFAKDQGDTSLKSSATGFHVRGYSI